MDRFEHAQAQEDLPYVVLLDSPDFAGLVNHLLLLQETATEPTLQNMARRLLTKFEDAREERRRVTQALYGTA